MQTLISPQRGFIDSVVRKRVGVLVRRNRFRGHQHGINNVMTIDPLDPNNSSGLANRGTKTATETSGILMRSAFTGLTTLQNDDIAGRFFLYPVPEPSVGALLVVGTLFFLRRKFRPSA
jgi:hypothetical protein